MEDTDDEVRNHRIHVSGVQRKWLLSSEHWDLLNVFSLVPKSHFTPLHWHSIILRWEIRTVNRPAKNIIKRQLPGKHHQETASWYQGSLLTIWSSIALLLDPYICGYQLYIWWLCVWVQSSIFICARYSWYSPASRFTCDQRYSTSQFQIASSNFVDTGRWRCRSCTCRHPFLAVWNTCPQQIALPV